MNKQKYQTKQGTQILEYMKNHSGEHITANQISFQFKEDGIPVGVATIYRHLDRMVEDGVLMKYFIDHNSPACYEYHPDHDEICTSVHCKCEHCGVLIHLLCQHFNEMETHLLEHHDFQLKPSKTVLYGVCSACGKA